ncbi:MAG: glycosyltransferase family 39 protein, partial [Rhodospirillales bacterium]
MLLLVLAVGLTFRDYGVAWDEPVQNAYGKMALNYYLTLGADRSSFTYINLHWYGALVDMIDAAANKLSPFQEYDTRHLVGGLIGVLGVAGTWRLGRFYGGPRAGLIAALLLALTPVWHGSTFINPKDVPFAVGLTWATLFMARIARGLPDWRWGDFIGVGLSAGVALGARVGGLIALVYLAAMLAMFACLALLDRAPVARVARQLAGLAAPAAGACALALAIMYFAWPWAQSKPIAGPVEAFRSFNHFPIEFDFPYFGALVSSIDVPWHYEPALFAVMLPEMVAPAFLCAAALGAHALGRRRRGPYLKLLAHLVLALTILFPMIYAPLTGSVLFDGLRHMLFVVPAVMVAAALALDRLIGAGAAGRGAAAALLALTVANQAVLMVRSHPYQYVVYNAYVGGTAGAEGRFELDYWGIAFREIVQELDRGLGRERAPPAPGRPRRVTVCGPARSAARFFPAGYVLTPWQGLTNADFV